MKTHLDSLLSLVTGLLALILFILFHTMPQGANPEYAYTVEVLFKFCFLPLCVAALLLSRTIRLFVWRRRDNPRFALVLGVAGLALVALPALSTPEIYVSPFLKSLYSVCWVLGSFALVLCAFVVAAKINNMFSGLICLLASILLFFGVAEFYFLATEQYQDTFVHDNDHSKYVLNNQAQAQFDLKKYDKWHIPVKPRHPSGAVAHRELYKNKPLFDVRYVFDDNNRRTLPPVSSKPGADILLFGCSFTFGYGLENEQTWAFKLSLDLGPDWRLTNYAFSAFGAQQMLDMLEDGFVQEPEAPFREALFLAIYGHLHRPTGLFDMFSSRYVLENGKAVRAGVIDDSPYHVLVSLPKILNGSQAAREISGRLSRYLQKSKHEEFLAIYLSLLQQSAAILKEKYGTQLTVLVWPNIVEILPRLEKLGIPSLDMRKILPQWDDLDGSNYHILKNLEFHPNDLATGDIAAGVAAWLRELRRERGQ